MENVFKNLNCEQIVNKVHEIEKALQYEQGYYDALVAVNEIFRCRINELIDSGRSDTLDAALLIQQEIVDKLYK